MIDFFDMPQQTPPMRDTSRRDRAVASRAMRNLMTDLFRGIEERADSEDVRLKAGITRRHGEMENQLDMFLKYAAADDVPVEILREVNQSMDKVLSVMKEFTDSHDIPMNTILD